MGKLMGVIFDMDGVIIQNSHYHDISWKKFFSLHGVVLTDADLKEWVHGRTNVETVQFLFKNSLTPEQALVFAESKESLYRQIYQDSMRPTGGLLALLDMLTVAKLKIGLATSAPTSNVDFVLNGLRIRDVFDTIIDATHVTKGKPDPEVYTRTVSGLGLDVENCIAIEDSLAGIRSAQAAGLRVIGITSTFTRDELHEADAIIDEFSEVNIDLLNRILSTPQANNRYRVS